MSSELLALLTSYGLPALFVILLITSAGAPFPDSLLLVAVGSFVAQGDLDFLPVVVIGTLGAVAGDQIGYAIGYWGGRPLAAKIAGADRIEKAEAFSRKWGGPGIFFSRWLVGPLGPWINITSGMTAYPWFKFVALDIAGELIWVVLYVSLGRIFSDKVQVIADLLGNLTWVVLGLLVIGLIGYKLWKSRAASDTPVEPIEETRASSS
ncbi:DedA family protein [Sphingomonas sanguinis]|uniref:DedA family protein n=1 Tax=Sphingomonas sanguinis TaxID=33051 RepID=UPI001C56B94D|nr:DedA family protein [Sphingomonas sanguinis]QXT35407.1 DedA family protein [Sphingomonas sanguinis]